MSTSPEKEFGKFRQIFWPIHGFEMKKFLPMFLMFACVSFNYSMLRLLKDSLNVTAAKSGGAVIPFLKLWVTTPSAILFMIFYVKIASLVSRKNLFYITISPFLIFFLAFPTLMFPNIDILHPGASADWLASMLPQGLLGLVEVYRNWTFSLFFVMAELWGSVCLSLLFWTCANEVTKVHEAKRFYGFLGIGANIPLLFVSTIVTKINSLGDQSVTIPTYMFLCAVVTLCIMGLYWYLNNVVMEDPQFKIASPKAKKKKVKMGFVDSMRLLAGSKYLACLAFMVLAYGISVNLVEVSWKHYVNLLVNGDPAEYTRFQSQWMTYTGISSIILMLFGTSNSLRYLGWGKTALITPVVLFIASILFFGSIGLEEFIMGFFGSLASFSPLLIAGIAGGFHNTFGKSSKYSFFDPTKEIAYIPLDEHTKKTGKAAIDGVGGRLGKSGGSLINLLLVSALGSIEATTPYVAFITLIVLALWIVAAKSLNTQFVELTSKAGSKSSDQEKPAEGAQEPALTAKA